MELYLKDRDEWRKWLEENCTKAQGIWLIYYKKASGRPRIPYNEAVEEALCFGWIDGKIKRVNDDYYMQWFTPRRPQSRWSKLNISRAEKLISEMRMKPAGLAEYNKAMLRPQIHYDTKAEVNLLIPDDLTEALKTNPDAYSNFLNFPTSSRKLYVFWVNDAKRPETRRSRILRIVSRSEKNMRAGMM